LVCSIHKPVPDPLRQGLGIMADNDAEIARLTRERDEARADLERVTRGLLRERNEAHNELERMSREAAAIKAAFLVVQAEIQARLDIVDAALAEHEREGK